jgi:PBP1b-binding outer membrane lipoprotein LpoB
MRHLFRRNPALILLAAIFVVSCEPVAPTPRAKWTPRPTATIEPEETPTPYPTATAQPTPLTSAQLNPKSGVTSDINPVIRTGGRDPLIPVFGRFPPIPYLLVREL